MKMIGEMTAVEKHGDTLQVELQAKGVRDASWRPLQKQVLIIADCPAARMAFHVGRTVKLNLSV